MHEDSSLSEGSNEECLADEEDDSPGGVSVSEITFYIKVCSAKLTVSVKLHQKPGFITQLCFCFR